MNKQRIYQLLEASDQKGSSSRIVDVFIMSLIVLNVIMVVMESVEEIYNAYTLWFYYIELISVIVFSIEYILRVWSISASDNYRGVLGRIRYVFTPMALVDLLAVLPFYLPLFGVDLRIIRMLRIFRLVRVLKFARYNSALNIIGNVFRSKREELLITIGFTAMMILIAATLMFYVEHEAQPEAFSNIPETMWWAIATLTTVGYGDVYPVTGLGKFFGGIIALLGIGIIALPSGIIASGFSDELRDKRNRKKDPESS